MEQEVKNENIFLKAFEWLKSHIKIVAIVVAVLVLAIILISIFSSGPKKAVKKYIKAMNNKNVDKYMKVIDFAGQEAWEYSFYDIDEFDEDDYDDFIEEYKEIDEDELKDTIKTLKKSMKSYFEEMEDDYKKYKIKIEEFKGVQKLGKDLYLVKAKISLKAVPEDEEDDEIDSASIQKFVVYKNKIIDMQTY